MTHIYFVRHGRTENEGNISYGRMPGYPLSVAGREEATKTGELLRTKNITQIFTSPLQRSFETAEIISQAIPEAKIEHVFDLNETESTRWQGLPAEQLFTNNDYETFINDPNADFGTENLNQIAARMMGVIQQILSSHGGKNVVCVSHEFPILALKFFLEKKQLSGVKTYHLPTGGVMDFVFDENNKFVSAEKITA